MRGGVSKMVDIDGALGDVKRVLDEQGVDDALAIVRAMLETLVRKNSELELERLRLLKKHLGKTSERMSAEQLAFLFALLPEVERPADALVPGVEAASLETSEEGASETTKPRTKKGKHGRKPLPDTLPRVEVVIPVPDGERHCSICGKDKKCIGHQESEVLQFEPARFVVEVQKREKLVCEDHAEEGVAVAEAPGKVIEKGRPGASLLARVVVGKYEDHEPLNRMKKMFERLGVSISVSTLADWVAAGALALRPIEMLIKKVVLESYVLQADDTGLTVLDEKSPGGAKRGHLWYYVGDATLCAVVYTPDWTKEGPGLFLAQRDGGYLVADAYKGYDHIFTRKVEDEELPPPIEVGCNAHARRGFIEIAEAGDPRAAVMIHHYKKLYDIERESKEAGEGPDERLARRQRESLPVLAEIEKWCRRTRETEPPKSALSGAVGYVINQWRALTRFVEDGALPIDNTLVERTLRGVAMGRRNYLFAGSDNGAVRAATLYTIIATCKLCGVEPMAYVADVLTKLQAGQWPYARLRELVPDEWRKSAPASALLTPKR